VVALLCAIGILAPASAAPNQYGTSATLTCERGAGATVWAFLYTEDSGALVNVLKLTCGTDSPTGARSMRVKSSDYTEVTWADYSFTVAGETSQACFAEGTLPQRTVCDGPAGGPGATLVIR
jgi:hypothetical protein